MKKEIYKQIFGFLIAFMIISVPFFAHAAIVPDCNTGAITSAGTFAHPCDFNYLILLINNIITFLLFTIATPLAALCFVYAGFLLLKSGGNSEAKTQAKSIVTNVVIGYVIGLAAWLVVHTILVSLGVNTDPSTGINTFLQN